MIDQHLKQQCFSFLTDKIVHWLVYFHSVFDCVFCSFNETDFRLVIWLGFFLFAELVELFYSDSLFLDSFFPNFKFIILSLFFAFSIFLFLFHSENLNQLISNLGIVWNRKRTLVFEGGADRRHFCQSFIAIEFINLHYLRTISYIIIFKKED